MRCPVIRCHDATPNDTAASMTTKPATPSGINGTITPASSRPKTDDQADDRPDHPAPVVAADVVALVDARELRVLGIQRLLDLIEQALLVLRERHDAS